ncbi:MAG TPA: DUF72 domain-containing protein [Dehalococcoidia bacterium]|nr:DUF72 domain-containing protein [Dehalococcoidia bacterium]
MSDRLRIGTSGWQYDHWRGSFYPANEPKRRWFELYSEHFSTVELNNSFYRQPSKQTWQKWHDAAPEGFCFAVKANRFITHMKRFKDPEAPLARFFEGAGMLKAKLGPVLYQAPPDFEKTDENLQRFGRFLGALPPHHTHVVEFRNDSWFSEETYALLRRHGVAFCVHDMAGLHCPVLATSDTAYVRLHGGPHRYAGNYGDSALETWAKHLGDLAGDTDKAWVFFNNDLGGHAPRNAARLKEMLCS